MLAPLVTAAAVSLAPSPTDLQTALADLMADPGVPVMAEPSARARVAALIALHSLGGLDADAATDWRWFDLPIWYSDHDYGRRLLARVRAAPADDWLPPKAWFAVEAAAYAATAADWHRQAETYRSRATFEGHQAAELLEWARYFDEVSCRYGEHAGRLSRWAGGSWQCPRAVVLIEAREWMGRAAWDRRGWPE